MAQVVDIPDPNLRTAVEKALGKASDATITTADMANLTNLEAINANISDLTGLEHITNLTRLDLRDNTISDLSSLAELTNLRELYLWDNLISDLSALAGLTNLRGLGLGSNHIRDISALSGLTHLTYLWLGHNLISDLSPLASLTHLTEAVLRNNHISDISSLVFNAGLGSGDTVDVRGTTSMTNPSSPIFPRFKAEVLQSSLIADFLDLISILTEWFGWFTFSLATVLHVPIEYQHSVS